MRERREIKKGTGRRRAYLRGLRRLRADAVKAFLVLCAVILILAGGVRLRTMASEPSSDTGRQYISVRIHSGDTLWSVAEEYCGSSSSRDIRDYVSELRQINHIENGQFLKTGAYLVVYTTEQADQ